MERFAHINKSGQIGLDRGRIAAQFIAKRAVRFLLAQPVLRAGPDQLHAVWLSGLLQQIKQVILHLHRMMQLPTQLAGIGHADRIHRAHTQLDLAG